MGASGKYTVVIDPKATKGYSLRGGNRDLFSSNEPQVILSGPADTGKTYAACIKAHLTCLKFPNCQGAIVRKVSATMAGSVLMTWAKIIRGAPVTVYGGERPEHYQYSNGSRVWIGGMDNADKVLSSERDFVYVNQSEELTLDDWELLSTRTTGRGSVMPYTQLLGDCNPSGSRHWIREAAQRGSLRMLTAQHKDNPDLFDDAGVITSNGKRRLAALDKLTGVRRLRLRDGVWATAEGAVYEKFNPLVHVCVRLASEMRCFYLFLDEGFTNPAVILLVGEDSDGRLHVFREFYERGVLQSTVVDTAKKWLKEMSVAKAIVDDAAAGLIADLSANGVPACGAEKGRVQDGIRVVENRLVVAGDGRPRLTIDPDCKETINEFESYQWKPGKDEPQKEYDHALDAIRYGCVYLDAPTGAITDPDAVRIQRADIPVGDFLVIE